MSKFSMKEFTYTSAFILFLSVLLAGGTYEFKNKQADQAKQESIERQERIQEMAEAILLADKMRGK